jgi:3-dehydroquinate synthase
MVVTKINVELGERSYEIMVGDSLLGGLDAVLGDIVQARGWRRAAVVTDANVSTLFAGPVSGALTRSGLKTLVISIEPGEKSKSLPGAMRLIDFFADAAVTRSDVVVALGGGVVGDLAGFAASVFKRGVDLLQLPTTLMSQVDSSIGGKTAVNLDIGKNLVGSFFQPSAVIADVGALASLPPGEYASGLAEVVKYRFLKPEAFETWAASSVENLAGRDPEELRSVVAACARIKAEIVSADERDTGLRAVLNYGHTLGHALEAVTGYEGSYTHGGAVSVGMVFAALVSEAAGLAAPGLALGHRALLKSLGLPVAPFAPAPPFEALIPYIARDKKNRGDITLVLLRKEGDPVVHEGLEWETLTACYARLLEDSWSG